MRARFLVAGSVMLLAADGCSVRSWNDYRSESAIPSVSAPDTYPKQTFGTQLAAYRRTLLDGRAVSRLAVGSGRVDVRAGVVEGVYGVFTGWEDARLRLGAKLYDHCEGTGAGTSCPADTGTSLIAIPDLDDRQGCVLAGAPIEGAGTLVVSCETTSAGATTALRTLPTGAPAGSRIGASLAAIDGSAAGLGVAFVGAPGIGSVYTMSVAGGFAPLPLTGYAGTPGADLGAAMASAPITTTDPLLLGALPPGDARTFLAVLSPSERRVYLLLPRTQSGLANDAVVVGCVDGPTLTGGGIDGFGSVLAAGDVDGDGMPELAIGANLVSVDREDAVRIVSLAELGAYTGTPVGCADPTDADDPTTRVLACIDEVGGSDTLCGGYGAALAFGDANGDDRDELLVGAPLTTVAGVAHAGAAYLHAGDDSLDVFVADANVPAVLVDSRPDVNDTLGLAVTFLPSQLATRDASPRGAPRAEPVASAPGKDRVFVYLCSGLAGDDVAEGVPRCIVQD